MALRWRLVRWFNRAVGPRYGLAVRKTWPEGDDGPVSHRHLAVAAASGELHAWAVRSGHDLPAERIAAWVAEVLDLWPRRPVRDNAGGSGLAASVALFVAARCCRPTSIVECGTWQGHTAWLFRQACPAIPVTTFDIEHDNLRYRVPDVDYRLGDWTSAPPVADPAGALVFFDDHVSHARRLHEAAARGYRTVLLDDDVPVHGLHLTGVPPAPTLSMLHDPAIRAGDHVTWSRRGRRHDLVVTADDLAARPLIAALHPLPDLGGAGWRPNHGTVLVRLADR
jgi:hypothetical protein